MKPKDVLDLILHALGGAAIAFAEVSVTGNVALSLVWPALVGFVRESEQARISRGALGAMLGKRIRASDVRHWSPHRLAEWAAWPVGAGVLNIVMAVL